MSHWFFENLSLSLCLSLSPSLYFPLSFNITTSFRLPYSKTVYLFPVSSLSHSLTFFDMFILCSLSILVMSTFISVSLLFPTEISISLSLSSSLHIPIFPSRLFPSPFYIALSARRLLLTPTRVFNDILHLLNKRVKLGLNWIWWLDRQSAVNYGELNAYKYIRINLLKCTCLR